MYPGKIDTTCEILESEPEDGAPISKPLLRDGTEAEYADNSHFRLWRLPGDPLGQLTDNYVVIWYENQGVWSAGIDSGLFRKPDALAFSEDRETLCTYFENRDFQELLTAGLSDRPGIRRRYRLRFPAGSTPRRLTASTWNTGRRWTASPSSCTARACFHKPKRTAFRQGISKKVHLFFRFYLHFFPLWGTVK